MTKKFLASRLFFTITNFLQILVKKLKFFFAKQCSIIENNSVLPSSTNPITDQYLANTEFTKDDIPRIICKLKPNKAHGHDMISIRILKMSGDAIIEPLFKIFKKCLKCGIFPDDWKKGNIVPIFKKGDKQNIKNYRPVTLLPICSKLFFFKKRPQHRCFYVNSAIFLITPTFKNTANGCFFIINVLAFKFVKIISPLTFFYH